MAGDDGTVASAYATETTAKAKNAKKGTRGRTISRKVKGLSNVCTDGERQGDSNMINTPKSSNICACSLLCRSGLPQF